MKKIHVLHLGVELPKLEENTPVRASASHDQLFTIICPANLIAVKGHHYLLEAISRMKLGKDVQLILAGDGGFRDKLTAQVRELGIEHQVEFRGHIAHLELLSFYKNRQVDLVVLPSLDLGNGLHEGIPVSLMEAMSFKIPVISTCTGGIPELLYDDQCALYFGRMVEGGDSEMLAIEMDKMVESITYRAHWAELGRLRIDDEFNQQKNIKELIDLIKGAGCTKEKL